MLYASEGFAASWSSAFVGSVVGCHGSLAINDDLSAPTAVLRRLLFGRRIIHGLHESVVLRDEQVRMLVRMLISQE